MRLILAFALSLCIGSAAAQVISPSGGGGSPANPSATAGPTAVNGSASTYMRSDAAPAVQQGSSSQKGIVQVDGTTITAASGVISTPKIGNVLTSCLFDVDVTTTGTETLFNIALPPNVTRYRLGTIANMAKSGTAWASASIAVYSGAGATGDVLVGSAALTNLTTTAANAAGNLQVLAVSPTNIFYSYSSAYLRVTTGSGQAVGGTLIDFCLTITPLPSS